MKIIKKIFVILFMALILLLPMIIFMLDIRYTNELAGFMYDINNDFIKIFFQLFSIISPVILSCLSTLLLCKILCKNSVRFSNENVVKLIIYVFYFIGFIFSCVFVLNHFSQFTTAHEEYRFYCHEICFQGAILCIINTLPILIIILMRIIIAVRHRVAKSNNVKVGLHNNAEIMNS